MVAALESSYKKNSNVCAFAQQKHTINRSYNTVVIKLHIDYICEQHRKIFITHKSRKFWQIYNTLKMNNPQNKSSAEC